MSITASILHMMKSRRTKCHKLWIPEVGLSSVASWLSSNNLSLFQLLSLISGTKQDEANRRTLKGSIQLSTHSAGITLEQIPHITLLTYLIQFRYVALLTFVTLFTCVTPFMYVTLILYVAPLTWDALLTCVILLRYDALITSDVQLKCFILLICVTLLTYITYCTTYAGFHSRLDPVE